MKTKRETGVYNLEASGLSLSDYLLTPDIFEGSMLNKYDNLTIGLSGALKSKKTQKEYVSLFATMVNAINGTEPDLFNPEGTPGSDLNEYMRATMPVPEGIESTATEPVYEKPEPIFEIPEPFIAETKETIKEPSKNVEDNSLTLIDYTDKSIVLTGNTFEIKEQIKSLGGKFNVFTHADGTKFKGWVFPKTRKDVVVNTFF